METVEEALDGQQDRDGVGKNSDISEKSRHWQLDRATHKITNKRNPGAVLLHPFESMLQWHIGMSAPSEAAKAFQKWHSRA